MKNKHLHIGIFALMLSGANIMASFSGNGFSTPGLFANVMNFDPAKLFAQEAGITSDKEKPEVQLADMTPVESMQFFQNLIKNDERDGFFVQYSNRNIGTKPTGDFDVDLVVSCLKGQAPEDLTFTQRFHSFKSDTQPSNFFLIPEDKCRFEDVKKLTIVDDPRNKVAELDERNNSWSYSM